MLKRTRVSVVCTPSFALNRLKKSKIAVFGCEKSGARFIFGVKDKDLKKVFAIFGKPCYNVTVYESGSKRRIFSRALVRAGLIFGAAAFVALAAVADSLVLKIEITGSGAYLAPRVESIVRSEGIRLWHTARSFDGPAATSRILALPQVTFCKIKKRGSVLCVDVQTGGENSRSVLYTPLVADVSGILKNLVAVCGTPAAEIGERVEAGRQLILPQAASGEGTVQSIALGYAEIEYSGESKYLAAEQSEESLKEAYASLNLESGEIISRSHTVRTVKDGVEYTLKFTCLHRVSINL